MRPGPSRGRDSSAVLGEDRPRSDTEESPESQRSQRASGSRSSTSARTSSVSGIERIAPSGPMTKVQNRTEKKLSVRLRLTASLTNFGWISTCSTTFATQ
ncbi:hypothetical protein [Leucobacter sp. MMO-40]|uniref:hypothetical protein n=1 Tax=Leucobacter sp. MMO-40 TaxID=3081263 RepID=UPI00301B67BF